ncbi:MAG TPA: ShlB/FhaC/HecB family hemolysin secretion/activation protein [Sulfurimonas sp.]
MLNKVIILSLLCVLIYADIVHQEPTSTSKNSICTQLLQITVDENDIFDKDAQDKFLRSYLGSCIDSALLQNILNTVSQYYIDKGNITTKPYFKEQNILDGKLEISVLKGYVEDIIHSETNSSDGRIATAFLFQKGELLNLRDLETSLEMMNRVPSYSSKFSIKPGTQTGKSIVSIQTQKEAPYRLMLGAVGEKDGYENNPYLNVDLSIDNLLNINDILTFSYNGSRVQSYYQSISGTEIDYSFPLSSYVISYTWFRFKYSQAVLGLNDTYRSSGDTTGSNLKVSKILHRTQNNKLEAAFSILYKDNKNYFSNELIDVSSYKTALFQADIIDTYYQPWGEIRNILSYYRGTDWLGARDDGVFGGSADEKLQFTKFSLDTSLIYRLPIPTYQINSNAHIQYTKDLLYDNNKLRIGSYYTVRGYEASYYGNNGYYIRNDFIKSFYPNLNQYFMQSISPFVGLDYGAVKCESNTQNACGSLAGAAIGVKTAAKNLDMELTLSRGLKHTATIRPQNLFRYSLIFKY